MADKRAATDGPSPFDDTAWDFSKLPDHDTEFISEEDLAAFAKALILPDSNASVSNDDISSPTSPTQSSQFITALNDWRPVHQRVRKDGSSGSKRRKRKAPARGKDETREGFVYTLLKWPLLLIVLGWIIVLGAIYLLTRLYIYTYEHFVTMRGRRHKLRLALHRSTSYDEWVRAAKQMDEYLGNEKWKETDEYAYYNHRTIRNVRDELRRLRMTIEKAQPSTNGSTSNGASAVKDNDTAIDDLRTLLEAAVKNNFVGTENPRLYSETYYGTKNLVQSFIDEVSASLKLLLTLPSSSLPPPEKTAIFKHLHTNYGRTALCLSGGASFAYYHFGVAKALLDAGILPEVITGTSGGALIAALLATRTDAELKSLIVPSLAHRITGCADDIFTWLPRWYRTGARFDSIDWARKCSWMTRGSLTFREAYAHTGRILNVTCIPSDPHSPTVLANYLTSPDCVIWSAVLASAAVPGILNPVVLMRKTRSGTLVPYSFGHKWKDGSLRTDVPLKALNTHFNVTFSIVSQVNPHINLFFFSSRGTVGRPVTHRRGRGWRGGFLGSATEQYLKLDLNKWLKVLRHLELLPRWMGQDWSEVWLQRFSGTVTIWPKSKASDFINILSDPSPARLARMIRAGQLSTFPKLKFVANRIQVEKLVDKGRRAGGKQQDDDTAAEFLTPGEPYEDLDFQGQTVPNVLSEEDLRSLLHEAHTHNGSVVAPPSRIPKDEALRRRRRKQEHKDKQGMRTESPDAISDENYTRNENAADESDDPTHQQRQRQQHTHTPSFTSRLSSWFRRSTNTSTNSTPSKSQTHPPPQSQSHSRNLTLNTSLPTSRFLSPTHSPVPRRTSDSLLLHSDQYNNNINIKRSNSGSSSVMRELSRQSAVFFDDTEVDEEDEESEVGSKEGSVSGEVEGER